MVFGWNECFDGELCSNLCVFKLVVLNFGLIWL